jgi:hypothetical protein
MRIFRRAQSLECHNLLSDCARYRELARPHRGVVDQDSARSALSQTATEARVIQVETVSQDIQQWTRQIDIHRMSLTIHSELQVAHDDLSAIFF